MIKGLTGQRWLILEDIEKAPDYLINKHGRVLGQLIFNRRTLFNNKFEEENIYPKIKNLIEPKYFTKLEEIAQNLANDIKKGKSIAIYGDYDADGITSTALLANFLYDIGVKVKYYIPSRFSEGYGLNKAAIKKISSLSDILIVLDSGTSAYDELIFAAKNGLKVFVLDHHEPKDKNWKFENVNILNPKLFNKINPYFKHLSTVGIVFYLMIMLRKLLKKDIPLSPYLDIVAIGTIADVVPLTYLNRILVKKGIEEINRKRRKGIKAMLNQLNLEKVSSFDVGFQIAPRINAAGRLDDAKKAVKLLISRNEKQSKQLAYELEILNKKRQKITENVFKESQTMIKNEKPEDFVMVAGKNWHQGVIGIVAGRLLEKYKIPSFVLAVNNGYAVASVRSTPEINIHKILNKHAYIFEKFGGHSMAAGFTIKSKKIPELKEILKEEMKNVEKEEIYLEIDMEVPLSYWDERTLKSLSILEPFGEENPFPRFIAKNLRIQDFMTIGIDNSHIKFWLKDTNGNYFEALWWGAKNYINKLSVGQKINIAYIPKISKFNNKVNINFIISDVNLI
ncbi:single-stranded-DNA-specific exonuclease RecJ [Hydrogenivirga sp. 128-5-R1-1]|uniref:single-stranded-DNA-specific exonuclease RecJ n=1 Tax=Hydrogenivirga sp. 128-5-R1-1 TaxID=392423 RepID=UPI00015F037D|nr:single-stranded-DNA-specific exonuclease RecJ [Hydrogenivirga sp. 128-5-R1-1]EDP74331.1 single-strand-DNA-specific exonuclease RecJ [Hydrogenivirga sp. 128-5-R1-1]